MAIKIKTAGPNIALIISKGRNKGVEVRIGGRVVYVPLIHRVDELSLELRTIEVASTHTTTRPGVQVNLTGVCQVKVAGYKESPEGELQKDINAIRLAAQHFIGKTKKEIEESISKTLEGHQRAIAATLTPEELYKDRESFSSKVIELAASDVRRMGLEIVSYTISEITDDGGYFEALGKERTEKTKAEAEIGAAVHLNEAKKKAYEESVKADLFIDQERIRQEKSKKDAEVYAIRARQETIEAQVVQQKAKLIKDAAEQEKLIVVQNHAEEERLKGHLEIERVRNKKQRMLLENSVIAPAEADATAKTKEAEAIKCLASARAEEIRLQEKAKAEAARAMALVETDKLHNQAKAYELFGQGALCSAAIEALPKIAEGIAKPLSKTEKMVFIGSDGGGGGGPSRFTRDLMRIVSEVPEVVESLTGINLNEVFESFMGGQKKKKSSSPPTSKGGPSLRQPVVIEPGTES